MGRRGLVVLQPLPATPPRNSVDGQAFAVGYDWRQDLQWLGRFAAQKIALACELTKSEVAPAAHSMGGTGGARAAFQTEPELMKQVEKVVFVCQPVLGTVLLYRRLFTGLMPGFDGEGTVAARAFRFLMGNSRAGFIGTISGQPGPLSLLPNTSFPPTREGIPWHEALAHGIAAYDLYSNPVSPPGCTRRKCIRTPKCGLHSASASRT